MAALFVLQRHTFMSWGGAPFRSYLAVDVFFLLSGFVIAHAYDSRIQQREISLRSFMLVRLIRLYPMYAFSVLVCAAIFISKAIIGPDASASRSVIAVLASVSSACFAPFYVAGNPYLFPLNHTYWSLLFELLTNFFYAAVRPLWNARALLGAVIVSWIGLALVAASTGNMDVGVVWSFASVLGGAFRATFGIFFGVLLYLKRAQAVSLLRVGGVWLIPMTIVALVLCCPSVGRFDWAVDLSLVSIVIPLSVLAASAISVERGGAMLAALGAASYPMYVLHLPASHAFSKLIHNGDVRYAPFSGIAFAVLMLAYSVFMEREIDVPVRRWLSTRLIRGSRNRAVPGRVPEGIQVMPRAQSRPGASTAVRTSLPGSQTKLLGAAAAGAAACDHDGPQST